MDISPAWMAASDSSASTFSWISRRSVEHHSLLPLSIEVRNTSSCRVRSAIGCPNSDVRSIGAPRPVQQPWHHSRIVTVPRSPSTEIFCPLLTRWVTSPIPRTAGIPYSRATIEPWARMLPMSVTRPVACGKSCVQAGVVSGQTSIELGFILSKSLGIRMTLATPVTVPGETAKPRRAFSPSSLFLIVE